MSGKPQPPVGQTYHEVLGDHLPNMTALQQRAVRDAQHEHAEALERNRFLAAENEALMKDVARLTRKLHEREETPAKRVRPASSNGNGSRRPVR